MKRKLAALALATSAVLGATAPAQAEPLPFPGGGCDDPVDVVCRRNPCGPDDLDCGMIIIICVVWVDGRCLYEVR